MAEGNGNAIVTGRVSKLVLTFNHDTFALHIEGEIANSDCALAIVQQAARYFETQLRQQAALQFGQQVDSQRRGVMLADRVLREHRG